MEALRGAPSGSGGIWESHFSGGLHLHRWQGPQATLRSLRVPPSEPHSADGGLLAGGVV